MLSLKRRLTRRQRERILRAFKKALENRDRRIFETAIREVGLQPDTPDYARCLMIWKDFYRDSGK